MPAPASRHADQDLTVMPPADDAAPFDPHMTGVDYGELDSLLGYAVRRAQIAIYADFVASLAPWNITPPRFAAMVLITRNPTLRLTQLAQIMGIARSGAVLLVDALEELGYAQRLPCPEDRRSFRLALTDLGNASLQLITQAIHAHDARVSRALTPDEREQLKALLNKVAHPVS